jgi:RNA polymerase sigma-70 factor (ECF subfamily)
MEDSDDELVARVARGDGAAFTRLVARHRKKLIAMTTRIVGSYALAEDVVQDVFTRAWQRAPLWRPRSEGSFGAWLARVATNLAIDHARKAAPLPLEDAAEPLDGTPSADAQLIEREDERRLAGALAALPARQRAAVALTYDQGLANAEAAAAMEISVGAFELLLVRARRTLRQAMTEGSAI